MAQDFQLEVNDLIFNDYVWVLGKWLIAETSPLSE